ncbi:TAXI family TRAP transporter solute-binding subunit [Sinisalibacter aestuarii]|uniref:C4-dicarboxylate ABC transporter substrate-binding protein n=1 Tax=Sinisalibacter aestuarii TaxID=2949426 RepID=A0ABQ5LPD2_9RHOB|nr:TAXI family TRAP transporter solute-binding subunit [Sinisalibacter aestuarii]GKY86508.1 C4-dicarboxylate ABC transporter substrate-binding protein [Sinisalibacter aestuarii]
MKHQTLAAGAAALLIAGAANAETFKMATIEPSLGPAIVMSTFANLVTDALDDVEIEVAGGGAATLHMLEVGRGNLDMSMVSPSIYPLMQGGKAMYANEPDAPALSENLALIMWFPYGQYHYTVRADSGIETLDDIEGTTVFLGPAGGGAYATAKDWIEATTGLVAGEDYEAITANWATGFQSFQDGKIDLYVNGCMDPCQQFLQITETEDIRFIGPEDWSGEAVEAFLGRFRTLAEVAAGAYDGQVNETAVMSHDTNVGIGVRRDLDDETVYQITKAFWENLESITSDAPWAKAISIEVAVKDFGMPLHPGAIRYYEEVGAL